MSNKTYIYCEENNVGIHSFYLQLKDDIYFLFNQKYKTGVNAYFKNGVIFETAINFSKANCDNSIMKTMSKLPIYIKYIEKEYEIIVLEQTKKKRLNRKSCA